MNFKLQKLFMNIINYTMVRNFKKKKEEVNLKLARFIEFLLWPLGGGQLKKRSKMYQTYYVDLI